MYTRVQFYSCKTSKEIYEKLPLDRMIQLFQPLHTVDEEVHFVPSMYAVLPLFALVAILLARRGILADEKLVRDSERIR